MTTFVDFAPSDTSAPPFLFQPTLDGVQYTLTVTWNMSGQRWYFNLYTLNNILILTKALIESPTDYDINLIMFYFAISTLVFRGTTQQFEVTP
jgi:hypothetical protein